MQQKPVMKNNSSQLADLFKRIPRRHTTENVKEIYTILDEYEELLQAIETESEAHEKLVPPYFETLDPVRALIKKSSDNKASKKLKDNLFDEGSGMLKDSMEELMGLYN